jgi:GntR family transcriptional regulator
VKPLAPITLDRDAEVPLGTQLTWVLRARITGGELARGERLPGARELAAHVGVNVNTVRAVFARLEEEGLLEVLHGRGTFVADRAGPVDDAAQFAAEVKREARRRGIDPRAVAAALYMEGDASPAPAGAAASGSGEAAARQTLRREIARLEQRLAELPALTPEHDAAAVPPPLPSEAGRLLTRAELTRQRDRLAEQVARAREQAEGEPAGREPEAAREQSEPARAKRHGPDTHTRRATLRWVPGG